MARMHEDDRGQVQTIEAFIATFILLLVLTVVVQATSVTPLTTSFTNQHVKYELQCMGQDILASLDGMSYLPAALTKETTASKLEKSVSDWLWGEYTSAGLTDATPGDWYTYDGVNYFMSATTDHYHVPQTELEKALTYAFSDAGGAIAYNVEVRYSDKYGTLHSAKMIWNGDPSDNSVTVSRFIALHDYDASSPDPADVPANCLIPDISTEDLPAGVLVNPKLHNVVEVRLTIWVM